MPKLSRRPAPRRPNHFEPPAFDDNVLELVCSPPAISDSFSPVPVPPLEQSSAPETTTMDSTAEATTENENKIDSIPLPSSSVPALPEGSKCSRCRHYKDDTKFLGRTRCYRTCSDCRFQQTIPKRPPPPEEMIQQLSDLEIPASAMAEAETLIKDVHDVNENENENNTMTRSKRTLNKQDATVTIDVLMTDDLLEQSDEELVENILDIVKQRSGYRYSVQNLTQPLLSSTVNFYGKCVQRSDLRRPLLADERKRQTKVLPTYNCRGKIAGSIHRDQRWIRLTLTHLNHHPPTHPTRKLMPEDAKLYIKELAGSDQSNSELYKQVVAIFGNDITRAQVYFWRREARNHR